MTKQSSYLIRVSDIIKIEKCSTSTASRKLQQVRFCLGRSKKKPVSLKEYCEYFEFNYREICNFLNPQP
jgi:hypothetical protein